MACGRGGGRRLVSGWKLRRRWTGHTAIFNNHHTSSRALESDDGRGWGRVDGEKTTREGFYFFFFAVYAGNGTADDAARPPFLAILKAWWEVKVGKGWH